MQKAILQIKNSFLTFALNFHYGDTCFHTINRALHFTMVSYTE